MGVLVSHSILLQNADAATRDRSHGQFLMARDAELAHQKHIHRSAESGRDFGGDRHSSARQRQNDDVIAARVFRQARREHATGVTAIGESLVVIHGDFPV